MLGYASKVGVGVKGTTLVAETIMEESPTIWVSLATTSVLCEAIALGLETGGSGYLVLAGTVALGCYSAGLD